MVQEIEVSFEIKTTQGNIIKKKYSDEINARYSTGKIKRLVRSKLYEDYPNVDKVIRLDIREEAEIYGNE